MADQNAKWNWRFLLVSALLWGVSWFPVEHIHVVFSCILVQSLENDQFPKISYNMDLLAVLLSSGAADPSCRAIINWGGDWDFQLILISGLVTRCCYMLKQIIFTAITPLIWVQSTPKANRSEDHILSHRYPDVFPAVLPDFQGSCDNCATNVFFIHQASVARGPNYRMETNIRSTIDKLT